MKKQKYLGRTWCNICNQIADMYQCDYCKSIYRECENKEKKNISLAKPKTGERFRLSSPLHNKSIKGVK